jgi:hypothetical protein
VVSRPEASLAKQRADDVAVLIGDRQRENVLAPKPKCDLRSLLIAPADRRKNPGDPRADRAPA